MWKINTDQTLKIIPWIVLIGVSCIITLLRLHSLNEPFERDLATYAYVAHEMLNGEKLYSSIIDIKPPGIYLIYMLTEMVGGYGTMPIVIAGIVFTLVSMIFLYLFLKKVADQKTAILGALIWSLASGSYSLQANLPNTELFINCFIIIAFWSFSEYFVNGKKYLWMAGISLALASFVKMNAVIMLGAFCLYLFISRMYTRQQIKKNAWELIVLVSPTLLLWAATMIYFYWQGRFTDIYNILIVSLQAYSGNIIENIWKYFNFSNLFFSAALRDVMILLIMALIWIAIPFYEYSPLKKWFYFMGLIAGWAMVSATNKYYYHYYQLLLPILTINTSLLIRDLNIVLSEKVKIKQWVVFLVMMLILVYLVVFVGKYLSLSSETISRQKYGDMFVDSRHLGLELKKTTLPNEVIYNWGVDPEIYFYSQRKAASGVVQMHILTFAPDWLKRNLETKIYNDVVTSQPAFMIFSNWFGKIEENIFYEYLKANYHFYTNYKRWVIYERNGRMVKLQKELLK